MPSLQGEDTSESDYRFQSELDWANAALRDSGLDDAVIRFRDELESTFTEEKSIEADEETRKQWVQVARTGTQEWRRIFRIYDQGVSFVGGIRAIAAVLQISLISIVLHAWSLSGLYSVLISVLFLIAWRTFNVARRLTEALFEEVRYSGNDVHLRQSNEQLRFRAGWNKGVMNSILCWVGILTVAVLISRNPDDLKQRIRRGFRYF